MIRRFVNLVAANYSSCSYSLHRLDVAKHLFYPSTADAEAPNAQENHKNGNRPSKIGTLRRLPPASTSFQQFPPVDEEDDDPWPPHDKFVLLNPHISSEGRILHVTEHGHSFLYDADARSMSAIPSRDEPYLYSAAIFIPVVSAAGAEEKEKDRLYVINNYYGSYRKPTFEVLDFNEHPPKWRPLPPPPIVVHDSSPYYAPYTGNVHEACVRSFTVDDSGRTICVSFETKGTYCFDTATNEWRHAGNWALPFSDRAEHVPELGTWLGFSHGHPYNLCAADLSAMEDDANGAPTLQHAWREPNPPNKDEEIVLNRRFPGFVLYRSMEWLTMGCDLLNLGSGRFCVARVFTVRRIESVGRHVDDVSDDDDFVVLTGVEVLRDHEDGGGLRMVKHKSKRFVFTDEVIKWVL